MMKLFLFILTCSCLMVIHTARKQGRCWIEKKASGFAVVCDASRSPRSKIPERNFVNKPVKERTRRRKLRLAVKCRELSTRWTNETNMVEALPILLGLKCPEATFLRETALKRNETQLRVSYKCCTFN